MDLRIKQILNIVVVIFVVLWLLKLFGVMAMVPGPIVSIIVALVVVGLLLWLVNSFIPMQGSIKTILNIVVIIAVILWLITSTGLLGEMPNMRVGQMGHMNN
jgi:hypothetical protein